jgi:hypothetical protein
MSKDTDVTPEEIEAFMRGLADGLMTDILPKMRASFVSLASIDGNIDIKICLEVGAALLLDKPLIIVASKGTWIPLKLRQVAEAVIDTEDLRDPAARERIQNAMKEAMRRLRGKTKQ